MLFASFLTAQPRLLEPIYKCEIECPQEVVGKIYGIMAMRRGQVIDEQSDSCTIIAELPVAEFLRSQTGGKAFPQCVFSHWQVVDSDPYEENSIANEIVKSIRKRKGFQNIDPPKLEQYLDKL